MSYFENVYKSLLQSIKDNYEIDDIILVEYGTTVVGLEMMRSVNNTRCPVARLRS